MTETVRFGLVGYGLFGAHHARAIAKTAGARLVAIAVTSEKSQQAARGEHPDASVSGDYRRLLERSDIDIVSVVAAEPIALRDRPGGAGLRQASPVGKANGACPWPIASD